jgi:sarcosine oxidase
MYLRQTPTTAYVMGLSLETTPGFSTAKQRVSEQIHRSNNDDQKNFDVIVIGIGSMGSSTCYYLAEQGVKVLGLEQFDIPNELSSHVGQSRIIRKAYFEHPAYVPLLEKAYQNWKHLEEITGTQVYFKTGLLYSAKSEHLLMKGVHASASQYNIKLDTLSAKDMKAKYPQINVPDDNEKLIEPESGFLTPERAILLYTDQALQRGAVIKTKTKVLQWNKTSESIEVTTSVGKYFAKKLIITAGPWTGKMIEDLSSSLTVTRQMIAWVIPQNDSLFELGRLPCWMIVDDAKPGIFYGFPILPVGKFDGPTGFKLAHHYQGSISDPNTINRIPTADDEANLVDTLKKFFPNGYKATHVLKTCMYTNTPDEHFILDFLPNYDKDVIVAAGFSGHGFKFASVVGEIMSGLAIKGSSPSPIGFLNATRLKK